MYPDVVRLGKTYRVGYGGNTTPCKFLGWKIDGNNVTMLFKDVKDGDSWSAYMHNGVMVVGSSANELEIDGEA